MASAVLFSIVAMVRYAKERQTINRIRVEILTCLIGRLRHPDVLSAG